MKTRRNLEQEIDELKTQMNEMNLLMGKLFYTGKLFHEFYLTTPQKRKVVERFDELTSIKKVKALYKLVCDEQTSIKM